MKLSTQFVTKKRKNLFGNSIYFLIYQKGKNKKSLALLRIDQQF